MTGRVTVLGLDGGDPGPAASAVLAEAALVVGGRRHMDSVAPLIGHTAETHVLASLPAALAALDRHPGPAAVLASGDPGFFGIVRALRAHGIAVRVVPAVSSIALAFARIGVPWDDAVVVSAHGKAESGRSAHRALATALAHPKAAIFTAPGTAGPEAFLPDLVRSGRRVYVAQRLGSADEAVEEVRPEDAGRTGWAHPNVVLAVDPGHAVAPAMAWTHGPPGAPDGWALPEEGFEHRDSMITKSEVRALALARLAPRPGTEVWDVGAGSGSVAVECARFGAYAVAFEKDPGDCARIRANAAKAGVRVDVREGLLPGTFPRAAAPDALFFGGGGDHVVAEGVRRFRPRRVVAALASVDRVRPVHDLLSEAGYTTGGTQIQASRLSPLPTGSLRFAAVNPVTLIWGVAP